MTQTQPEPRGAISAAENQARVESDFAELMKRPALAQHVRTTGGMLAKVVPEIDRLLPPHLAGQGERLAKRAFFYLEKCADIRDFTPESFVHAVLTGAEIGLPIDGRLGYAVSYSGKLAFQPDYKGIVAVARRSGLVTDCHANVVRSCDKFSMYEDESGQHFRYEPKLDGDGPVTGAIAVLKLADGTHRCVWMSAADLTKVQSVAKTQKVWNAWPDEMRKKTVLKRALKLYQDTDSTLSRALEIDDEMYDPDKATRTTKLDARSVLESAAPPLDPEDEEEARAIAEEGAAPVV